MVVDTDSVAPIPKDAEKKPARTQSLFGLQNMLSYLGSAAVTSIWAWFAIGRRFGTNIHELDPSTQNIRQTAVENIADLVSKRADNTPGASEFRKKWADLYGGEAREIKKFWKKKGISNTLHELQVLKTHQKLEVLFGAIAVVSVSLGVILGVTRSKELMELLHRHDSAKEKDAQAPQI